MPAIELTLYEPNAAPRKLRLDADTITMGRTGPSMVQIKDRYLSRHHAEMRFHGGGWRLHDAGSVNGTFLNGTRVESAAPLKDGDRIRLGDTEVVIGEEMSTFVPDLEKSVALFSIPAMSAMERPESHGADGRDTLVQRLAMELIEDRPIAELFDLIADRIMDVLKPSRVALALLKEGGGIALDVVKLRRRDDSESTELKISTTLLHEVINDRKVLSFEGDEQNQKLAMAESIMGQSIRSAVCAPLLGANTVLGVLYIDYRVSLRVITEADLKLVAQVARIAAMKLESTRLRESALEQERMEGSLRLARDIQMRMIPRDIPRSSPGALFEMGAAIRPAKHVGGDFYDFHLAGTDLYFCIADVAGKGVPAALMMAVTRTLFRSLIMTGASPGDIVSAVNRQLCSEADPSMFVTAFCAVLDLTTGVLRFANAGHNRPLLIAVDGAVSELTVRSGLALGALAKFTYVEEQATLQRGEMIYLYTDGISEATNPDDEMFSEDRLKELLHEQSREDAHHIAAVTVEAVENFARGAPQSDDLTILCIRFAGASGGKP